MDLSLFFQANDKNVTKGLFTKLFRLGGKIIQEDPAFILIFTNEKVQFIWTESYPA